jgi:hypothetical protein
MSDELTLKILETTIDGESRFLCTFVSHELVFKFGLIGSVIVGEVQKLENGEFNFQSGFKANPIFKETIFDFIRSEMINDPNLVQAAAAQGDGLVQIIDQRTVTPQADVPPYDIMGAFKVENSQLVDFYENSNYQIQSENGFPNFGASMNSKMNSFLESLLQKSA